MDDFEAMYWESYDDQDSHDFDYVGIAGEEPAPIENLDVQVKELYRTRGHDIEIRVYKDRR